MDFQCQSKSYIRIIVTQALFKTSTTTHVRLNSYAKTVNEITSLLLISYGSEVCPFKCSLLIWR